MNHLKTDAKCLNDVGPVVVVDDSQTDLLIVKHVYMRAGLPNPLKILNSGLVFLGYIDAVRKGEEDVPAMVLMDVNMPEINGFEAIAKLRQREEFKDITTIVMLTNSDSKADIERAKEVGANGFHTKDMDIYKYVEFFKSLKAE